MDGDLFTLYRELKRDGIIFCFSGAISQGIVEGIGETLKQKMALEETRVSTMQKVFGIFVEQMQNISNYSAEKIESQKNESGTELRFGILTVGRDKEMFCIRCGNYIIKEDAGGLSEKLYKLRNMSKEELNIYFRERRKAAPEPGSKGAGLGFIEMARKSTRPIEFSIVEVDDVRSFFSIKVMLGED
ncbi:MAG: hypothetical protein HQK60_09430 [Deltaproteobacteria bacterium]|nr:hypothetical protein [Deltaproteobacteria bacterium]